MVSELRTSLLAVVRDLRAHLIHEQELGLDGIGLYHQATDNLTNPALDEIKASCQGCTACPLSESRSKIVFGAGNPWPILMLIGEGPGQDEDALGLPFVGAAGKLLDRILAAIHIAREEVYIDNVVKCRPPRNRTPQPGEIAACRTYLDAQIGALKPRLILALGATAAQTLLETSDSMAHLRGRFFEFGEALLMPTYHPAFLLRKSGAKRAVWEDVQKLEREYRKYRRR